MPIPVPRSIINRQWQSAHCYRGHQRPCGHTKCGIWCVVNGALPAVAVFFLIGSGRVYTGGISDHVDTPDVESGVW